MARTTCSPVRLRMRVVLRPIRSTVPLMSSTTMKSPTRNGLSTTIEMEANRSPSTFWRAKAIATPAIPSPAMRAVMSTPMFSSAMRRTTVHRAILAM